MIMLRAWKTKKDKNSSCQAFVGGGIASVWVVAGGSSTGGAVTVFEVNGCNMYMDG